MTDTTKNDEPTTPTREQIAEFAADLTTYQDSDLALRAQNASQSGAWGELTHDEWVSYGRMIGRRSAGLAIEETLLSQPSPSTPTREQIAAERARQIAKGYTAEHDANHGAPLLLEWSARFAEHGEHIKAAAMVEAAREVLRNSQPSLSTPSAEPEQGGPISQTGHQWPCTRFYRTATDRDACTCDATVAEPPRPADEPRPANVDPDAMDEYDLSMGGK